MTLTLKSALRFFIYFPVVILVLLALAIGTPVGSRVTIFVVQALIPSVSIDYDSGTLNKNIKLKSFTLDTHAVKVVAKQLSLDWNPICYLHNQLCINDLKAEMVDVNVKAVKADDQPDQTSISSSNNGFPLPFTLSNRNSHLKNVSVSVGRQLYKADILQFKGNWDKQGLNIAELTTVGFAMSGVWQKEPQIQSTEARTSTQRQFLPTVNLPFPIFIQKGALVDSNLELDSTPFTFKRIDIKRGNWVGTKLELQSIDVIHAGLRTQISGSLDFKKRYPTDFKASLSVLEPLNIHQSPLSALHSLSQVKQQDVSFSVKDDFSSLSILGDTHGQINSNFTANLNLIDLDAPSMVDIEGLTGNWSIPQGKLSASNVSIKIDGTIHSAKFDVNGLIDSPYIPKLKINGNATIDNRGVSGVNLHAHSPSGNVVLMGNLKWNDGVEWNLNSEFRALQVKQFGDHFTQELPSIVLNGTLVTDAAFKKKEWHLNINHSDLTGKLKGQPLHISGKINVDSNYRVDADNFEAKALGSEIYLTKNTQTNKLSGKLMSENLGAFIPTLRGKLSSVFTVNNSNESPSLWHKSEITNLNYGNDLQSKEVQISGRVEPKTMAVHGTKIKVKALSVYSVAIRNLYLGLDGNLKSIKAVLKTKGKANVNAEFYTKLNKDNLNITIPALTIKNKSSVWQLNKTIDFNFNTNSKLGRLSPFCLNKDREYFCSKGNAQLGKNGLLNLQYSGSADDVFHAFLPKHLSIKGKLNAQANAQWSNFTKPIAKLDVSFPAGQMVLYPSRKVPSVFPYQRVNFNAKLDNQWLTIKSKLQADSYAHWLADFSVSVKPARTLKGYINLSSIRLSPLAELFPIFSILDGQVDSNIKFSGNLHKPIINGAIKLTKGEVAFIKNPTNFHDILMNLTLDNDRALIDANWSMNKGKANLSGNLSWPDGRLLGELNITGKHLTAIEPPLAILTVSPKVNIKLKDKNIRIAGNIDVTGGDITISPLPKQGVPLSQDVVFTDNESTVKQESPINISSDLNINVSNSLKISGSGLTGNLGGQLSLSQETGSQPLMFGNIKVQNGNYRFLGQTLNIQKGGLEFVGPLNNPSLDIEAVKDISDQDVTVGVKVTGTVNRPKITLFSNPTLEQAEIVSYLLQGRGFDSTNGEEQQNNNNALLLSAALTLGAQAGDNNPLAAVGDTAESLAQKLGVSNVQLNANDDGKVAISGYIGDRLLLKYGYGVFDPGYELTVRYYLLSKLYLETVSSAIGQSLDIYYRFDIGN
ncbi:translocation/assembly module TamB domain-containing protein [Shewanella sp. 202IG2-18]|uniref:translocation/assembly module TamB domain-containing protein n=1 Tax=Parashewanella hymeniacidonis TaxID=2807618 RepID=UPI0019604FBA|nr:translocation/assembly module TamB domain-containing protein [Parashewanella hymeniacidonis]MBM7072675.1 translocation/assembly module TamB domain-containing protein [Parashewanella hymeniacidonis]